MSKGQIEFALAIAGNADRWVPACGGTETEFTARSGKRLLYCFNPGQSRHAYLDVASDIVLSDSEAANHLQMA